MPCHECEEEINAGNEDPLRTPVKQTGNGGGSRVESDDEDDYDSKISEEQPVGKAMKWNGKAE